LEGVTNGGINPRCNRNYWELSTRHGTYAIRIALAEALVLFLDPVVKRTKKLPESAKPVVRWWQQHRRPGPQRFENFVMPLLNRRELARIAECTPSKDNEYWRDCAEAERKALAEHFQTFIDHFNSTAFSEHWFLNLADLEEIGVTASSSTHDLMERWLKPENLLQRHTQMAAHMRLLYKLGGEYPDLADLWSMEVKIQTVLGRFIGSAQAYCVGDFTTSQIHRQNCSYYSPTEPSCLFFKSPEIEEKGLTVLRGLGAWSCFVGYQLLGEDSIWEDILDETSQLLTGGVFRVFLQLQGKLPLFESALFNNTIPMRWQVCCFAG
jgi:hypothetical protein